MGLDVGISAALTILTLVMAYLGIHLTLHPADSVSKQSFYKIGFAAGAFLTVALVIWQTVRNGTNQRDAQSTMATLHVEVNAAKQEAQDVRRDLQAESERRQQAERDLAIIVQAAGQATRTGVAADIRSAPLKVQNAGPTVNQAKMNQLAEFIRKGKGVQEEVPAREARQQAVTAWLGSANQWWNATEKFLTTQCAPQAALAASDLSQQLPLSYPGINSDEQVQVSFRNMDRLMSNLVGLLRRPELCP